MQLQELTSLLARDAKLGAWSHQGCFQKSAVLRYSVLIKLTGAQVDIIDKSLSECLWRMASEPRAFRASQLYTCSAQTRHALPMWTDHFCSHVLCICTSVFSVPRVRQVNPPKKISSTRPAMPPKPLGKKTTPPAGAAPPIISKTSACSLFSGTPLVVLSTQEHMLRSLSVCLFSVSVVLTLLIVNQQPDQAKPSAWHAKQRVIPFRPKNPKTPCPRPPQTIEATKKN